LYGRWRGGKIEGEFNPLHILRGQQLRRLTLGMSWRNKCGVVSAACRQFQFVPRHY
jgi:hypothetical protein